MHKVTEIKESAIICQQHTECICVSWLISGKQHLSHWFHLQPSPRQCYSWKWTKLFKWFANIWNTALSWQLLLHETSEQKSDWQVWHSTEWTSLTFKKGLLTFSMVCNLHPVLSKSWMDSPHTPHLSSLILQKWVIVNEQNALSASNSSSYVFCLFLSFYLLGCVALSLHNFNTTCNSAGMLSKFSEYF